MTYKFIVDTSNWRNDYETPNERVGAATVALMELPNQVGVQANPGKESELVLTLEEEDPSLIRQIRHLFTSKFVPACGRI